jgi:hypothetical protein
MAKKKEHPCEKHGASYLGIDDKWICMVCGHNVTVEYKRRNNSMGFEAHGKYVIVDRIERKAEGSLIVKKEERFVKGRVITCGDDRSGLLKEDMVVVFDLEGAAELELDGFPDSYYVMTTSNIVGTIEEDEKDN